MIPKIIHYCWFGNNPKNEQVKSYIQTWRDKMPEYEIVEWNEGNFDIGKSNDYVREAYNQKKWAFVSDYVRLVALYQYGGIYLDTDVEVLKSFNLLLENEMFVGFESKDYVSTAVIAAQPKNSFVKEFLDQYQNKLFLLEDGSLNTETNVRILTRLLKQKGLLSNGTCQKLDGIMIYPQKFFSSNNFYNIFKIYCNTAYAYHHYAASWYNGNFHYGFSKRIRHYLVVSARNIFGTDRLSEWSKKYKK